MRGGARGRVGVSDRWIDAEGYVTRALVEDATRLLLVVVFLLCAFLVWMAWRRREGGER